VEAGRKPWWQQATALVTVTTGGVISGFNFVPGAAASMSSPTGVPVHLLALQQAGQPAAVGGSTTAVSGNAQLRPAIVNVAKYYLGLAQTRTAAQMETLIWAKTSGSGADHGPSCAAFASLTLELAAQAVGQQSWVTGGGSYPWPLHTWADVRVDTNPASPDVESLVADAQQHGRWHAVSGSYRPEAGDWVVFDGHVEVVTSYSGGVLHTIGADSDPGLTVNAHSFRGPLAADGVAGFVDNGNLTAATTTAAAGPGQTPAPSGGQQASATGGTGSQGGAGSSAASTAAAAGGAGVAVPGLLAPGSLTGQPGSGSGGGTAGPGSGSGSGFAATPAASPAAAVPGVLVSAQAAPAAAGSAAVPGAALQAGSLGAASAPSSSGQPESAGAAAAGHSSTSGQSSKSGQSSASGQSKAAKSPAAATPGPSSTSASSSGRQHQAFISSVAPGAIAAQQRYGVPAAVTIAQAIEESAWGSSELSASYHNLFGIKGSGTAGSVSMPTAEYEGGQWITVHAQFRAYHNDSESIADHAELLATSGYYTRAMADRGVPDAFANALTGVYATDPSYGANLIALMKLYSLYRFDISAASGSTAAAAGAAPAASAASPSGSASGHSASIPSSAAAAAGSSPGSTRPGSRAQVPGAAEPALAPTRPSAPAAAAATAAGSARTAGGSSRIPGLVAPGMTAGNPGAGTTRTAAARTAASQPGPPLRAYTTAAYTTAAFTAPAHTTPAYPTGAHPSAPYPTMGRAPAGRAGASRPTVVRPAPARPAPAPAPARRPGAPSYQADLPSAVTTAFFADARAPLSRSEHLYRDVAAYAGIAWELLAALDWLECQADPRRSPVHGEKLGAVNPDGTSYVTKSNALGQCACDLAELAAAVYGIDLARRRRLSVRELAAVFAGFRWGAILRRHGVSAMEFPYSVAGLTAAHQKMRWPDIDAPDAPDRPGGRFREEFGAVPVVLSLGYPATV
jgi:flagellum-specific peptidoglycan hydrolase FlgJ